MANLQMSPIQGFNARVRITPGLNARGTNAFWYNAAEYEIRITADDLDVSNFEDSLPLGIAHGVRRRRGGLLEAEVVLKQATWDPSANRNPWRQSVALKPGRFAPQIEIFPADSIRDDLYYFPYLVVLAANQTGTVQGLQPLDFTGRTDGPFFLPGDTIPDNFMAQRP